MTPASDQADETLRQVIARSHHLLDMGEIDELVDTIYLPDETPRLPWADFGFARWTGLEQIRVGYRESLDQFAAAVHTVSNLYFEPADERVRATYYVQGWHWLKTDETAENSTTLSSGQREAAIDFVVLGRMTDRFVWRDYAWRLESRSLHRLGPGVAIGSLPSWLNGLGESRLTG